MLPVIMIQKIQNLISQLYSCRCGISKDLLFLNAHMNQFKTSGKVKKKVDKLGFPLVSKARPTSELLSLCICLMKTMSKLVRSPPPWADFKNLCVWEEDQTGSGSTGSL